MVQERCLFDGVKEVASVQGRIAVEVKDGTMEIVGARFGDNISDSAVVATILGREVQGLDLEFFDGVHRRKDQGGPAQPFVVVGRAVENEVVAPGRRPVGDEAEVEGHRIGWGHYVRDDGGVRGSDARLQIDKLKDLASVQWELCHLPGCKGVFQARFLRLHQPSRLRDDDGLGHCTYL